MVSSHTSKILGVFLLVRHGDRQGFYQDPFTYTASSTVITPLGTQQHFQLGTYLRSIYLNPSSSSFIPGLDGLFNTSKVQVQADGGDEGGVIYDSAVALTQGLWPPTPKSSTVLANGTKITSPHGGYQYVPIDVVNANEDVSLEGFADCNTFNAATLAFYNSSEFAAVAAEAAPFLQQLPPFLDGRSVSLINMFNIYDYMNVQSIHNATFAHNLPPTFLAQATALANFHEYGVFTSAQPNGPGNIAGTAILPSILSGLNTIANASSPEKLFITAISYKPFLSLFNMTGAVEQDPALAALVDYAAAVVLEVHEPSSGSGEPVVRFLFKNGTIDNTFTQYGFLGSSATSDGVPLSQVNAALAPLGVNNTLEWCQVCDNWVDRGCAAYADQSSPS